MYKYSSLIKQRTTQDRFFRLLWLDRTPAKFLGPRKRRRRRRLWRWVKGSTKGRVGTLMQTDRCGKERLPLPALFALPTSTLCFLHCLSLAVNPYRYCVLFRGQWASSLRHAFNHKRPKRGQHPALCLWPAPGRTSRLVDFCSSLGIGLMSRW